MVRVLVVEDDGLFARKIVEAVQGTEYSIIGPAINGLQAINLFEKEKPDLALIDIELSNSDVDGIGVAEYIVSKGRIPFAFISRHATNKSPYFARAGNVHPNEYLPKTPDTGTTQVLHVLDWIARDVTKATKIIREPDDVMAIATGILVPDKKDKDKRAYISKEDVVYVTVEGGICRIYPSSGEPGFSYIVSDSLKKVVDKVKSQLVIRIHRYHAINLKYCTLTRSKKTPISNYDYCGHISSKTVSKDIDFGPEFRPDGKRLFKQFR